MLTTPPTPEMIAEWQSVFKAYQSRLVPNRKITDQVIAYLAQKYPLEVVDTAAGLDQADLNNYYLVANYIACLEKFNLIDQIIPIPK